MRNKERVGERIKKIRLSLGKTGDEFGMLIDPDNPPSQSTISKWERNVNLPNNKRLAKIAKEGGISVERLLRGGETMRDKKTVGVRIKLIRNALNETLEEFGKRFNTSKTTVYNWEIGRNLPNNQNFEILKRIAEDFGIPVERPLRGGGVMRDTAQSVYIKNTFQITDNLDKGLYEKPKELIRDLKNAQQRYKENLSRMDGRNGR